MTDSGGMHEAMAPSRAASAEASAPPAPATTVSAAPKRSTRWAGVVANRVSSKSIAGAFTVLVLASTAAFGGLATAAVPPLPEIAAGETFTGAELEMTPQRAVLVDELPGSGVFPEDGERVLAVILDVTNLDTEARSSTADGSVGEIRLTELPEVAPSVARYDDATASPWLQPGVAATVVLSWVVPADLVAEGDDIRIALHTATEYVGTSVIYGEYWDDIEVAGYADLVAEDVGAGADQ
ncbi:hypothetical protein ACWGJP_07925 [Microbacterium sp. NPDC055903]